MTFIRPRQTAASIPSHNCTPVTRTIVLIVCAITRPGRTRLLSHGTSSASPMVRPSTRTRPPTILCPTGPISCGPDVIDQYVRAGSSLLRKTAVHTDPKIGPVLTFENAIDVPRAKLLRCQVISDQDGHLTLNCGHFVQCLTVGRWTSWRHSARGSTKSFRGLGYASRGLRRWRPFPTDRRQPCGCDFGA